MNGNDLLEMFSAATRLLEANVDTTNALNVFPVPDGDTGTNMHLTMRAVVERSAPLRDAPSGEVAAAMAKGALMGARGNSGVILSQFFRGMSMRLHGTTDFGASDLAGALQEARTQSYRAVGEPVEGTILTVISSAAAAAREALDDGGGLADVLEAASYSARRSVAMTPSMLPVLSEAGVVDAGGHGLAIILEAARRYAKGEAPAPEEIAPPEPVDVPEHAGVVSSEFLAATDRETYGYCTQFLVEGEGLAVDEIRETLRVMAHSAVVVGDEQLLNVHVHVDDPGPIVSLGVSRGTLSHVKIENMDAQHAEYSAARRSETEPQAANAPVAVVAVAWGDGLEAVFASLGAAGIVTGGNTMNPSVEELGEAIDSAPSDRVILLPNNGNVVPAARQAAEYSPKSVRVVPTDSIPRGFAALLALDSERGLDENATQMEEASRSVTTGEVTEAVRAATLDGVAVEQGSLIGLIESELVAAGEDLAAVVVSTVAKASPPEGGLVTLYRGERVAPEAADQVATQIGAVFPGVEVEVVDGGQPYYHFFLSVE